MLHWTTFYKSKYEATHREYHAIYHQYDLPKNKYSKYNAYII